MVLIISISSAPTALYLTALMVALLGMLTASYLMVLIISISSALMASYLTASMASLIRSRQVTSRSSAPAAVRRPTLAISFSPAPTRLPEFLGAFLAALAASSALMLPQRLRSQVCRAIALHC